MEDFNLSIDQLRHEIKTPLAIISILVSENYLQYPNYEIKKQLDKIYELINFEAGLSKNAALSEIINKLPDSYKHIRPNLRFKTNISTDPVMGEFLLHILFTNLVNNTIKHSEADEIEIEVGSIKEYIRVIYRDNGKGISDKELINYLNSENLTHSIQGKSGLRIIKNIIKSIDGDLHYTGLDSFELTILIPNSKNVS